MFIYFCIPCYPMRYMIEQILGLFSTRYTHIHTHSLSLSLSHTHTHTQIVLIQSDTNISKTKLFPSAYLDIDNTRQYFWRLFSYFFIFNQLRNIHICCAFAFLKAESRIFTLKAISLEATKMIGVHCSKLGSWRPRERCLRQKQKIWVV